MPPSTPPLPLPARTPQPAVSRGLRSWWARVLGAGLGVAGLLAGAAWLVVGHVNHPWVKRRIQALVLAKAGVELDYEAVSVRLLAGLDVEGLVAHSPSPFRPVLPDIARIGKLRVRWSPGALLGKGRLVSAIEVDGVAIAVGVDEHGSTSLDALGGGSSSASKPPTPLSRVPAEALRALAWLGRLHVANLAVSLVRTRQTAVVERDTVEHLAFDLEAQARPADGVARLVASAGRPDAPLLVRVARQREGTAAPLTATALLSLEAQLTHTELTATLDVRVRHQNLLPGVAVNRLAHAEARLHFDTESGRIEADLRRLTLFDDAATADASLSLPNRGPPVVTRAAVDADLARLVRLVPPDVSPVRIGRGEVHLRADGVAWDRPERTAAVTVEGQVADVALAMDGRRASLAEGHLSLRAHAGETEVAAQGQLALDGLALDQAAARLTGSDVALTFEAKGAAQGPYTGRAELRVARLATAAGGSTTTRTEGTIRQARMLVQANALVLPDGQARAARGDLSLELEAASLEARAAVHAIASGVRLEARLPLEGAAPFAGDATLGARTVRVSQPNGQVLVEAPLRVALGATDFALDVDRPAASQGRARIGLELGALHAALDATKRGPSVRYAAQARAGTLGDARRLVPEGLARRVPWSAMGLDFRSDGRIEGVTSAAPELHHHSELSLAGAGLDAITAQSIAIDLRSDGTAARHQAHADVRTTGLSVGGTRVDDNQLTWSLAWDRRARSLRADLSNHGLASADLALSAALDEAGHEVAYRASGQIAELAPLRALLAKMPALQAFDLSALSVRLASEGVLSGVVSSDARRRNGALALSPDLPRTAAGRGTAELEVKDLHWTLGDRAVHVPAASWRGAFRGEPQQQGAFEGDLTADEVELGFGRHRIALTGVHDRTRCTASGTPGSRSVEVSQQTSIQSVEQDFAPMYPMGRIRSNLAARWGEGGVVQVADMRLENEAAGLRVSGKGLIDWGGEERRLSFRANLEQDLARASNRQDLFVGKGKAAVDLSVDSTDLRIVHTKAMLRFEDAHLLLPSLRIALEAVDGEVPVATDWRVGRNGLDLLRDVRINPYTTLRFTDQHPLLSSRGFLSIGSLTTPFVSIAPFAANLQVEQNLIALSQLEMGIRGGSVTGNGILDWNGAATKLHVEVRATGVRSSHDEPFDGNAALVVDASDHSIEGRADILRIGKRHLLDLLDFQDPRHLDPGLNRIRTALAIGYPKSVRISFNHGFASAGVTLGGLARLVSVDDVRGIPIGPLMERVVGSLQTKEGP